MIILQTRTHVDGLTGDQVYGFLINATDRDYWATAGNGYLGTGVPRTLRLAAKFDL